MEVEGSRRGRWRGRGRDPLQDDVRVELRLGAVEARSGLQQTLLTPATNNLMFVCCSRSKDTSRPL